MTIKHLNPAGMHRNPAFSQGTVLQGAGRLVIVGGQNAVAADGSIIGDDVGTQTRQALRNVLAVLAEAGATQQDVAKLTIYLAAGQDAR
jgi:2-iminobutanoate/2-iminopropanoate deaminase